MRVVAIQHAKTRYYVAMNAAGKLYCQATFNADCKFKENIFENYWNIYARLASIEDTVQNVWPHTIKLIDLECTDKSEAEVEAFLSKYIFSNYSETIAYGNQCQRSSGEKRKGPKRPTMCSFSPSCY